MAKKKSARKSTAKDPNLVSAEKMGEDLTLVRVRSDYDDDEIAAMAKDAASINLEIERVTDEKKAAVADYTQRVNALAARRKLLSERCERGYEISEVECVVHLNGRTKIYKDRRTGEEVGREQLAPGETVQPELAVTEVKDDPAPAKRKRKAKR